MSAVAQKIAALFVYPDGSYADLEGVELWTQVGDARLYNGPYPVVAHPPCARWSRANPNRSVIGKDGGCFRAALRSVVKYGGVLEHPASSAAWRAFGLNIPPMAGGWVNADFHGLWTCHVEQGHFGHPAPKATWLLARKCELPHLPWGPSGAKGNVAKDMRSDKLRSATPPKFRDLLVSMARSVSSIADCSGRKAA